MNPRVTIEDIAAEAGVSRQTVTRAMNGMPRISESTRARVLEISERLGYRPSRFAANLARSRKVTTVGFVVDSFRNPYYSELTADLLDAASTHGWQVTVWSHEREPELDLLSRISNEVDVVVGYLGEEDERKILAAARGVPVVLMGRHAESAGLHSVTFDFDTAFTNLAEELHRSGTRHVGMLESHLLGTTYRPSARRSAFERAFAPVPDRAIVVCEASAQSVAAGEQGMHALWRQYPEVDTVIAFSDLMAMGALRAAHSTNRAIPTDVEIIGIDGLSLGAVTSPALSSLAILGGDLATEVANVVEVLLADPTTTGARAAVVPSMLWRESALPHRP